MRPQFIRLSAFSKALGFLSVGCKKLTAAFDGGVLLLGVLERQLGIAEKLAWLIADPRNHDILPARILALASGYEDAADLDHRHADPAFKLAGGRVRTAAMICARADGVGRPPVPPSRQVGARRARADLATIEPRGQPTRAAHVKAESIRFLASGRLEQPGWTA